MTKQSDLARYHRRAAQSAAAGLTRHGAPRRRVLLTADERKARALDRWRRRAESLTAAGLTTRGTPRRQRQWQELAGASGEARNRMRDALRYQKADSMPSVREAAWVNIRAQMEITIPDVLPTLERIEQRPGRRRKLQNCGNRSVNLLS